MKALTPVVPVSDFLKEPDVFASLSESPIILTLRGRPHAVLIDIDAYHEIVQLQQRLEGARTAFKPYCFNRPQTHQTTSIYRLMHCYNSMKNYLEKNLI